MMNVDYNTFWKIADLLTARDNNGEYKYSIDEVVAITNASVDVVELIDLVANICL